MKVTWSSVADVSYYRIYYVFLGTYFVYDPTYPGSGYEIPMWYYSDLGTTTGTSFTETYMTQTGNSDCEAQYEVWPTYASGKVGGAVATATFDICA